MNLCNTLGVVESWDTYVHMRVVILPSRVFESPDGVIFTHSDCNAYFLCVWVSLIGSEFGRSLFYIYEFPFFFVSRI